MCLSVTLHIVDLWQYYVCCTRSGVTRCTLIMMLYLCCMWRYGLHPALWSHIGTLMRLLAAEPRSTAWLLFSSQYLCGTILVTSYSMVYDWRVSRGHWPSCKPMPFYRPSCSTLFVSYSFPILFFHSMVWYCGAGVFGLIGCGTCHMAYIITFYIFLPSLNNNTIFIFSSYFI